MTSGGWTISPFQFWASIHSQPSDNFHNPSGRIPLKRYLAKMDIDQLKPNLVVRGALFPEAVQVITTIPLGDSVKLIGQGLRTNQVYQSILTPEQLFLLEVSPETERFVGDAKMFRLGVEAQGSGWPTSTIPTFLSPLPESIPYLINSRRSTNTSCVSRVSGSFWPTTPGQERPSWQVCS